MINFVKLKYLFILISLLYLVPGVVSLALFGLKPSIDFTGGTVWELKLKRNNELLSRDAVVSFLGSEGIQFSSVQASSQDQFLLKMKPLEDNEKTELYAKLKKGFSTVEEIRFETLGPTIGREVLFKALVALVLGFIFIFVYITYQFKDLLFGTAAIIATLHDTLILLGSASLFGYFFGMEVDTLFVTAILTALSFSVHDTVVVYDRIRESIRHYPGADLSVLVNKASNETLVRSLNNSLTVLFMLGALVLLGGESLKWFSIMLFIGTVTGTYSSVCTAAPLLVVWQEILNKRGKWKKTG